MTTASIAWPSDGDRWITVTAVMFIASILTLMRTFFFTKLFFLALFLLAVLLGVYRHRARIAMHPRLVWFYLWIGLDGWSPVGDGHGSHCAAVKSTPGRKVENSEDIIPVVILNWNGEDDTVECLKSIRKSVPAGFVPVLVDNGPKPVCGVGFATLPRSEVCLGLAGARPSACLRSYLESVERSLAQVTVKEFHVL
jgi:hypothetical protein